MSVEIEIFSASSYDGVIQALGADQIEFAFLDSSAYAAAYSGTDGGVEPLISRMRKDGTTGYYSVVVTRREDGYSGISDLKAKQACKECSTCVRNICQAQAAIPIGWKDLFL